MKPEDLRKEFEKEMNFGVSDDFAALWHYAQWLEKRLSWRTDEPEKEQRILIKHLKDKKEFISTGFYSAMGNYFIDGAEWAIEKKTFIGWQNLPE